jgi:hypothetical protein
MAETDTEEIRLLREIRDLLRPIADAHQDAYDERRAERDEQRRAAVAALVNSTDKRRKAWDLADGKTLQRDIAKAVSMDEGGASRYFKSLRDLGAIEGDVPKRTMEV